MKKWVAIAAVLALAYLAFGGYPSSPLQGKVKAVTVTKKHLASVSTDSPYPRPEEKTVCIQDPERVVAVERSLQSVWSCFLAGSMDGLPRYRMRIEYADGKAQTFVFTRTEWEGSGRTPRLLLDELERNGL